MDHYEIAVLFHPDLEINLDKPLKKVEKLIKDAGGKIEEVNNWEKRKLAYPIQDQGFAVYVFYTVQLPPKQLAPVKEKLSLADEIIRHLVVKFDPEAAKADKATEKDGKEKTEAESETTKKTAAKAKKDTEKAATK